MNDYYVYCIFEDDTPRFISVGHGGIDNSLVDANFRVSHLLTGLSEVVARQYAATLIRLTGHHQDDGPVFCLGKIIS